MSGASNRKKGHDFERDICSELRDLGFEAVTSRSQDRRLDDMGVDIVTNLPYNIQCKATRSSPAYQTLLKGMPKDKDNLIFHAKPYREDLVVMQKSTFYELIDKVYGLGSLPENQLT